MSDSLQARGWQYTRFPLTTSWSLLRLTSIESVMPSSCTGTQLRLLVYRSLGLPAWKGTDACLWHSLYSPQSWKSLLSGPLQKRSGGLLVYTRASPVAQQVKSPPAMQEMRVRFLGGEDPLEEGMSTHSNILGCLGNPMDRWAWWATVHGVAKEWDTT